MISSDFSWLRRRHPGFPVLRTALLLAWGLSGCATEPVYWYKPGFTQQEFTRDTYECERDTRAVLPAPYIPPGQEQYWGWYGLGHQGQQQGFFQRCMEARGYGLVRGVPQGASTIADPEDIRRWIMQEPPKQAAPGDKAKIPACPEGMYRKAGVGDCVRVGE